MSNIHKFVEDPAARAKLKETSGIGTEATRAATIETLFERDYLTRKGKQILSTPKGRSLIAFLEKPGPDGEAKLAAIADPVTTARWEDRLTEVANGKLPREAFVNGIAEYVRRSVALLAGVQGIEGTGNKDRATAPCPICGGDAVVTRLASKKRKGVYFWACSNREAHPLLADDQGKPGAPFGTQSTDQQFEAGPECPHCAGTVTQVRQTASGKAYFRCPSCKAAFWPDRADPQKIGSEWEARSDSSLSSGKPGGRSAGSRSGNGRKPGKSGDGGRK